jgi:methanogenic corrinoid protein MtbC1
MDPQNSQTSPSACVRRSIPSTRQARRPPSTACSPSSRSRPPWASGEASVGQEHFASNILRGRLLGLARGWDSGDGPRALLACAPGELHDLGLIAFGLALRRRGWRITFLGPDTPSDTLVEAVGRLEPALIVVSATARKRLRPLVETLIRLDGRRRVAIAGAGASAALAEEAQVELLDTDPVTAAAAIG